MDFLYAAVLLFFAFYLGLYIKEKKRKIKNSSKFSAPAPTDLGELFQSYFVIVIILGFILYFIFR